MRALVEKYCELPRPLRKPLWKWAHNLIQKWDQDHAGVFLNYGYAATGQKSQGLQLQKEDFPNRYGIQLYDHVAKPVSFSGARVLEVGCGRGGGASWLVRSRNPRSYVGMDISKEAIGFCQQKHSFSNLSFVKGDAESLPFKKDQFDIVLNVESARCYGSIPRFFEEVKRVLSPRGKFLFADMIKKGEVDKIRTWMEQVGFSLEEEEEITSSVVQALRSDSSSRMKIIKDFIPSYWRKAFAEFSGVEGSRRFDEFNTRKIEYWRFMLRPK
ncbi:MAG: class I SAM-dependent methyltransferase [Saprospiraceae bacterium]|nr:class I SAM-dependent methyltransferase [Saprospiraceae bacterium]